LNLCDIRGSYPKFEGKGIENKEMRKKKMGKKREMRGKKERYALDGKGILSTIA